MKIKMNESQPKYLYYCLIKIRLVYWKYSIDYQIIIKNARFNCNDNPIICYSTGM